MRRSLAIPGSVAHNRKMAEAWNRDHKLWERVRVTKDDGSVVETRTTSAAWMLGEHTAVILLQGFSGAYSLSRVEAIP